MPLTSGYRSLFRSIAGKICGACAAFGLLAGVSLSADAAGLLRPANSSLPELKIHSHQVKVVIEDGYATTRIDQVFTNPHSQDLEAVYSFPVPEQAAVGEFSYWIDGKPVTGEVVAKQQARQIYNDQKTAGNRTALTEQDDYRSFDSRVYPVKANDQVKIRLVYVQPAEIDNSIGRFLYPLEDGVVDEHKNAFWLRNEKVEQDFGFELELRSRYPIDELRMPQHPQAVISNQSPKHWHISLGNPTPTATAEAQTDAAQAEAQSLQSAPVQQHQPVADLSRDILLYWRLAEGLPGAVDLVSYRAPDAKQGTFMLTLTPGNELPPISGNRDWVFVLDTSGSMAGKYATLLEGVRQGLQQLPSGDRFRLITFNKQAKDLSGGYQPVELQRIDAMINKLQQNGVGGSTNLYAGLKKGITGLDSDRASALVLVTDGVANVGTTEKRAFLKLLQQADVRLFTFVMGNSANRPLLQGMTEVSNGFASQISNADDVMGRLMQAATKLNHAALRDLKVEIDGVRVTDLTPAKLPPLYRGQQLVLMGHYFGDGDVEVRLSGRIGTDKKTYQTRVQLPAQSSDHPELERLWALRQIEALQQQQDYYAGDASVESDTKQAITDLAVQYGLVTDYTSLLVVEEQVFQQLGIERRNQKRIETEHQARQDRSQNWQQSGSTNNGSTADSGQTNSAHSNSNAQPAANPPMFSGERSTLSNSQSGGSGGGSGALDPSLLLLIGLLALSALWGRRHRIRLN
ncbi:VIT and vWA domain-containing protein [Motiliproteus sp.]|uniref:VIT and vWA domain-containing protein n=1 Tax=Motiliproteus sp. TaxID=1898955 RepID=UPI003BAA328D